MTHERLEQICTVIRRMKTASDRLSDVVQWLESQRDAARLQTTKAIYQAILDRIEQEENNDG